MTALPALYKPISSVRARRRRPCSPCRPSHHPVPCSPCRPSTSPCALLSLPPITSHHPASQVCTTAFHLAVHAPVPAHHVQRCSRGRPAPCPHRSLRAVLCGRVPSHALAPQHVCRLHRCCCRCSSCHVHHRCLTKLHPQSVCALHRCYRAKGHL